MVVAYPKMVGLSAPCRRGTNSGKGIGTMKKQWFSAALILLLTLLIPAAAWADVIYPAPEDFTVGEEVDHLLATLDPGGTVWTDPELLPEGLRVETEESESGVDVYLRGVPTTAGVYDLIINYSGHDTLCTVTILPAVEPVAIEVSSLPTQTSYTVGDTLDPAGSSIRVDMSDGSSVTVSEGLSFYPTLLDTAGTQIIEVHYGDLVATFPVEVAPVQEIIEGIGVVTLPEKVIYDPGDALEPKGLSIRVYTNKGHRDVEADELVCSPAVLEEPGQQTVTVSYGDHQCTFTVTVLEEEAPASLAVYRLPEKLEYEVGDTLDPAGLVLVLTSNRDSSEYLDKGYTCEPTVLETQGSQEITVRYGDLSCVYYVTVAGAAASPTPSSDPEVEPSPTAAVIEPTEDPSSGRTPHPEEHSGKVLVAVIVIAAFLALAILAVYVVWMNRGGKEYFAESIRDLFRRK